MSEPIIVKPYEEACREQVARLILEIQQNEFQIPITLADQPDLNDIPGFYQTGAGNFWVASSGGEAAGTVALIDIGNGQAALRKMFVRAAYRGREHNTAGLLLSTLFAWARGHGIRDIYLGTTAKFLAAHRFYEKNGFVQVAREELPAAFPVMKVDTRFYRYSFAVA